MEVDLVFTRAGFCQLKQGFPFEVDVDVVVADLESQIGVGNSLLAEGTELAVEKRLHEVVAEFAHW